MTQQGQDPYGGGTPPAPGQQPGYQQQAPPPGQPGGMGHQPPVQDAGIQPPVANLLSYLFPLIAGLIMYFTQRDREVRFHAAQAILWGIAIIGLVVIIQIVNFSLLFADPTGGFLVLIFGLVTFLLFVGIAVVSIYLMVQGYQQKHVKLPILGNIAEGWAGGPAPA